MAVHDRSGATTVWERWDGIDADGGPFESLNHCSKGAVITFLHRYVAGDPAAGRRSRLPALPGRAAAWWRDHLGGGPARQPVRADRFGLAARRRGTRAGAGRPPRAAAGVRLPDGPPPTVASGRHAPPRPAPPPGPARPPAR